MGRNWFGALLRLCQASVATTLFLAGAIVASRADGPTPLQLQAQLASGPSSPNSTVVDPVARQLATSASSLAATAIASNGGDASLTVSAAANSPTQRTLAAREADRVNVEDFGAVPDLAYFYGPFAMNKGATVLYTNAYRFNTSSVGQTIIIPGAGPSGTPLVTTITAIDKNGRTNVTVQAPASTQIGDPSSAADIQNSPLITVETGTDNTVPIDNAINFANSKITNSASYLLLSSDLYFPAGEYLVGSLNFTGIRAGGFHISGEGAHIHGYGAGNVTVDALGATFLRWNSVEIDGDLFSSPRIGLQIGRFGPTSMNSAGGHSFDHLTTNGNFTLAAVLNENAETVTWNSIRIANTAPNAYGYIGDGVNHFNVTSAFLTTNIPVDSGQSFDENLFLNPTFFTTGVNATPLWIANAQRLRIVAGYIANTDTVSATRSAITLYTVAGVASQQLDLDVHSEALITSVFKLTGAAGIVSMDMEGLRYRENGTFASASIFSIDPSSSLTSITMENADFDLAQIVTPGIKLFGTPSAYQISGRIYIPATMTGLPVAGQFSGILCSGLTCDSSNESVKATAATTAQTLASVAQIAANALPSAIPVRSQSSSYQLLSSDCNSVIRDVGAASHTYTVASGLPIGCKIDIIQTGAGVVSIAGGSGETLEQPGQGTLSHSITGPYGRAVLIVDSASSFVLDGDVK